MMPELGKYAATVLGAYCVSLVLIVALTVASLWRARRVKRDLDDLEERRSRHD